jgi:hypothetical protein
MQNIALHPIIDDKILNASYMDYMDQVIRCRREREEKNRNN